MAILGAGGIGFDVAQLLSHPAGACDPSAPDIEGFSLDWGVDVSFAERGGLRPPLNLRPSARQITLYQRKPGSGFGAGLSRTRGWANVQEVLRRGVAMVGDVEYGHLAPEGLHVTIGGVPQLIASIHSCYVLAERKRDCRVFGVGNGAIFACWWRPRCRRAGRRALSRKELEWRFQYERILRLNRCKSLISLL